MASVFNYIITFLEVYGIWCALGLLGIFFISLWIRTAIESRMKKEDLKKPITKGGLIKMVSIISLPFLCIFFITTINPSYLGYGYAIEKLNTEIHTGNVLWGIDYYSNPTGGFGTTIVYRIQCIDLNTGEITFKKLIDDDFEIEGTSKNNVWATINEELVGINIFTGKTTNVINEKTLQQTVPELGSGVHEYHYNKKTDLVDVVSNDGADLYIDPETNRSVKEPLEKDIKAKVNELYITDTAGNRIVTLYRNGQRQTFGNENDKSLNKKITFLNSQFMQYDTLSKQAFTFSYEKMDKKNFIIRCLSIEGKLLWEVKQDQLKVGDFFEPQPKFNTAIFYMNALIVSTNGFIFSLNKTNGNLNWLTRM